MTLSTSNPYFEYFNVESIEELEQHMMQYNAFIASLSTDESYLYQSQLAS